MVPEMREPAKDDDAVEAEVEAEGQVRAEETLH
jgi:hypothetical protein